MTNEVGLLHDAWTSARTACALVEDLPERRLTAMTTMARVGLVLYQATGEPDVLDVTRPGTVGVRRRHGGATRGVDARRHARSGS